MWVCQNLSKIFDTEGRSQVCIKDATHPIISLAILYVKSSKSNKREKQNPRNPNKSYFAILPLVQAVCPDGGEFGLDRWW